jgi:hypothetical protein
LAAQGSVLFPAIDPRWTDEGADVVTVTAESDVDPFDPFLGAEPRGLI